MLRMSILAVMLALSANVVSAVQLEVTVTVTRLNENGFIEFKAESDQKGEKATGHLGKIGETKVFKWEMGNAEQNIWYWWDTLDGEANLKVVVTGAPGIPVTLFEAHCTHRGKGEQQVGKTLAIPISQLVPGKNHYRRHPGMSPYLSENKSGSITHIKECNEPQPMMIDPPPFKGGHEWDLIWE
jgi:hypothetical protein